MPTEPVKIPQNVYIEDRIIGPLSLRQIIIMALGAGFSYLLFSSYDKAVGNVGIPMTIILWTPAAIAAAFAMVNINDLSLARICMLVAERMVKPSVRTWAPREGISITIHTSRVREQEQEQKTAAGMPSTEKQISELSHVMDRQLPVVAVPEEKPMDTDPLGLFANEPAEPIAPAAPAVRAVNPSDVKVDVPTAMPNTAAPNNDLSVFRDVFPPTSQWH